MEGITRLGKLFLSAIGLSAILASTILTDTVLAQPATTSPAASETTSGNGLAIIGIIAIVLIVAMIFYLLFDRGFSNPAKKTPEKVKSMSSGDTIQSSYRDQPKPDIDSSADSPKAHVSLREEPPPAASEELPSLQSPATAESALPPSTGVGISRPADLPGEVSDIPDIIVSYSFSISTHDGTGGPIDVHNQHLALLVVNLTIENLMSELFRFYPRINTRLVIGDVTYNPVFHGELERIFWGEVDIPAGTKTIGRVAFAIPGTAIGSRPELKLITSQPHNIKLFRADSQDKPKTGTAI
jgi:hypothetical protein